MEASIIRFISSGWVWNQCRQSHPSRSLSSPISINRTKRKSIHGLPENPKDKAERNRYRTGGRGGELSLSFIAEFDELQKKRSPLQEDFVERSHSAAHAESDYIKLPAAGGPRTYTLIDINIYEKRRKERKGVSERHGGGEQPSLGTRRNSRIDRRTMR